MQLQDKLGEMLQVILQRQQQQNKINGKIATKMAWQRKINFTQQKHK